MGCIHILMIAGKRNERSVEVLFQTFADLYEKILEVKPVGCLHEIPNPHSVHPCQRRYSLLSYSLVFLQNSKCVPP